MSENTLVITADTSMADAQIAAVEARTIQAANRSVATVNRSTELGLLALQAQGKAVDATFRIQALAVRTAINTFIQTRAAIRVSNPLMAAETIITGSVMLYLLYEQLQAIESGQQESNAQMAAAYSLLRQAGGVYL